MFISLYTNSHLKQLKRNILVLGFLLTVGSSYALAREVMEASRPEWLVSAAILLVVGGVALAVAQGKILMKDAYFSMNPSRLCYRLSVFGSEHILPWSQIKAVQVSDTRVVFKMHDNREVILRLSMVPDERVARHIKASIGLAAMEQHIVVNNVLANPKVAVA